MSAIPFRQSGDRVTLHLLDANDAAWLAALVDEAEGAIGRPWRELLDRLDRLPARTSPPRWSAAVQALRRTLGGRVPGAIRPARVRALVLGRPALGAGERDARIASAAVTLERSVDDVEAAMWSDLPGERLVTLPGGRPGELAIAAAANLAIVQRALQRAYKVRLHLWGNARAIARAATLRGLLVTCVPGDDRIVLDISGPLSLFHRTTVYGRALGTLVPELAWCERFELEMACDLGRGSATIRLAPPILLPPAPPRARYDSQLEARFARDLTRRAPHWRVVREPTAVPAGDHLVFPDFVLIHRDCPDRRWWVELVGFWTTDYLTRKFERYRAAGLREIILCIDANREVADGDLPVAARVVRYVRHVDVDAVLAIIDRTES